MKLGEAKSRQSRRNIKEVVTTDSIMMLINQFRPLIPNGPNKFIGRLNRYNIYINEIR